MRSLAISSYTTPDHYDVIDLPTPSISSPDEVLVKVHAASINPVDVKLASGAGRFLQSATFPYKIGLDLSGTVTAIGKDVNQFKVGDEVYGALKEANRGSVSDFAVTTQHLLAIKPKSLTHAEAASLPTVGVTAIQVFDDANARMPQGLEGRVVFVPAALSGTGSIAIQLAKHVYGAYKVITTASTAKIPKIDSLLGSDVVDQVVNYTTKNPVEEISRGSVDFMIDTIGGTLSYMSLLKPQNGLILSISTVPSGHMLKKPFPQIPFYVRIPLDLVDWYYRWRVGRWGAGYECMLVDMNSQDLDRLRKWVDGGKIRPVVGKTVRLDDLTAVRDGCNDVYSTHGGIGKMVIEIL